MNRPHRHAILLAALLLATFVARPATAGAPVPPSAGEDTTGKLVELVSPAAGATLLAGSSIVVEWEPGSALAALPRAEEWELFLSLDGGRTYLARLTPHLDLTVRRVTVRVPELPSSDVRLLVRVGDERDEREQVLPGRYRVAPAPLAVPTWRRRLPDRGEPARPGAPGVVVWVEGARDGTGWVEREADPPPALSSPQIAAGRRAHLGIAPRPRADAKHPRAPLTLVAYDAFAAASASTRVNAPPPSPRLSQLCRRNE